MNLWYYNVHQPKDSVSIPYIPFKHSEILEETDQYIKLIYRRIHVYYIDFVLLYMFGQLVALLCTGWYIYRVQDNKRRLRYEEPQVWGEQTVLISAVQFSSNVTKKETGMFIISSFFLNNPTIQLELMSESSVQHIVTLFACIK